MPRPLQHGDESTVRLVESALADLRNARDKLAKAGASNAVERVRSAILSTTGAVRHANRRANAAKES
jgi:hypothetical protein